MTGTDLVAKTGGSEIVPFVAHSAEELERLEDSPSRAILIGSLIAGLFFVVLLGWAAVARLDAAAFGEGQVTVSGNRQTVQHRDGGNIAELLVRDGQRVAAGQVMIRLSGSEAVSTERALAAAVIDLQAQQARLEAEIRGGVIRWPASFAQATGDDRVLVNRAIELQLAQQRARSALLASNRGVLRQQAAEASRQGGGFAAQAEASSAQRRSLEEQLTNTRRLADEGFVSRNSVRALERAIAELDGAQADFAARAAATREQVGTSQAMIGQTMRKNTDDSAALLRDTQFQLNETLPRWIAARDRLERTLIKAPIGGRIVGLRVFSVGSVVEPGKPILDIVPENAPLVIKASFQPADIDGVYEGREAEVKFLSIFERELPLLLGVVRNVSADTLRDETTGRNFYTAEIVVPDSQIAMLKKLRGENTGIRPGVPVQVTIKLRRRTALEYFMEPLTGTFRRALLER